MCVCVCGCVCVCVWVCVCVCVGWLFLLLYTPFSEGAKVPALARARANEKVGERERAGGEKTM